MANCYVNVITGVCFAGSKPLYTHAMSHSIAAPALAIHYKSEHMHSVSSYLAR